MGANYPAIVRKFNKHTDGTEYVMAAHMNDVQDEVMAIEGTLGTKPHVYNPASGSVTAYASVGSRLDTVQRKSDTQQIQINGLLDASNNGWSLPITNLYASGTNIPPTKSNAHIGTSSDWYKVRWTSALVDTDGIFSSGYYVTIPKGGWWIITTTTTMRNPYQTPNVAHNVWARVKVDGTISYEIGKADSSATENSGGWHRLTTASGTELFTGDRVFLELRHDYIATDPTSYTKQTLSAAARIQLTYIRGIPSHVTSRDGFYLPDEISPDQ